MSESLLLKNFDLLATAPGGVARLRELILTLAVQGKLIPQDPNDEPASELLKKIRVEKERLIFEGKIKRDKPLAEISQKERPFDLPVNWAWERFGVIAGIERGGSPRPIQSFLTNDPDGLNWIKIGDTEKGGKYITATSEKIRRDGLSKTRMVFPGDFLLTNSMSFGRPYITQIEGCIHDGWLRISPPSSLNKDFLFVLLSSRFIRTVFEASAAGGVVLNLNADKVRTVPIPLPPQAEQARIVTRVEELMKLCDSLEQNGRLADEQHAHLTTTLFGALAASESDHAQAENWQRVAESFDLLLDRPKAVDALEETIIQLAVRGLLVPQDPKDEPASELLKKIRAEKDRLFADGRIKRDKPLPPVAIEELPFELPEGWEWGRMGDAVNSSEAGWSPTCIGSPRRSGHWGVLKVSAVSWGAFDANANKELPADLAPRPEYEVKDGDFLLSRANTDELVARSVVVGKAEPQLMLSDKIIRLDVSSLMNRDFLNLCNNAIHARTHYIANASGTSSSMKNVSREVVLRTPVPLPPAAEQSRIVFRVEHLRRLCSDLRHRIAAARERQFQLTQALVGE
jgi:type I restriction enzyme, S subunit